ncbi:MAG: hypothetical protein PUA55_01530 [Mycoplasma sp.]|nr:hypothetical protein [Mycoplasma sp.]
MEYYVIYDLNDNIVAYCDTLKELSYYTGLRTFDINYKFKKTLSDYILFDMSNNRYKIYKFS